MATGRIGVTPTLRTRWSKQPTAGTTSLSGLDDNSVALVYDVGYEAVYRNGALLSRGNDYTATNGTTVTLIDATLAGDIIEILANQLVPLTDAISKGQFNAKGALLSATAASTPGVLAVGANDTVLTADSTTSTGLKWATAAAGGMTLLSTTTLSGATTTISSINQTYNSLFILIEEPTWTTGDSNPRFSIDGSITFIGWNINQPGSPPISNAASFTNFNMQDQNTTTTAANMVGVVNIYNYASTTSRKIFNYLGGAPTTDNNLISRFGMINTESAISQIRFTNSNAYSFNGGTVKIYGVK